LGTLWVRWLSMIIWKSPSAGPIERPHLALLIEAHRLGHAPGRRLRRGGRRAFRGARDDLHDGIVGGPATCRFQSVLEGNE